MLLTNKKTQIMRLHMMCLTILTPLKYSNAEEIFWTYLACHMEERAWKLQEKNTLRRCWILYLTITSVTAHHCIVKISNKKLADSRKRKKNMPNVTPIALLWILYFIPPPQSIHKGKMQTRQMRDKLIWTFMKKR